MKNRPILCRVQSVVTALAIVCSLFCIPIYAVNTMSISFEDCAGHVGDEVVVPVRIENNEGIAAFRFKVEFDAQNLEFVSADKGPVLTGGQLSSVHDNDAGYVTFTWFSVTDMHGDGDMVYLTFKLADDASGEYDLSVSYLPEDILNDALGQIPCTVSSGTVVGGVNICGVVVLDDYDDIPTYVSLIKDGSVIVKQTTIDGVFSFESVPVGEYEIQAVRDGFDTGRVSLSTALEDIDIEIVIALENSAKIGDLTYRITDGEVSILDCVNSAVTVSIPTEIKGYPVTSIAEKAFRGCSSLTSISIPDSITSIAQGAFSGCSSLESITIPFVGGSADADETFGHIFGTAEYDGGVETKQYYASGAYNTYYIPESLRSVTVLGGDIPYGAFDGAKSVTSITVSDETESIGNCAFRNCVGITEIEIPSSVKTIGAKAFYGCIALESITLPEGVESIGDEIFYGCTGLERATLPSSLKAVSTKAFYNNTSLASVVIPERVENIGDYAFYNCTALAEVTIPVSVTSIGTGAFRKCDGIETVIYGGLEPEWTALANRPECDNVIFNYGKPAYTPGDLDGVEGITDADALYLLMYTFFPDMYPVDQPCDYNGDGSITDADALHLLMHTFFPDIYPIA